MHSSGASVVALLFFFIIGLSVSKGDVYDNIITQANMRLAADVNSMIPNGNAAAVKDLEGLFSPTANIQIMDVEGAIPNITVRSISGVNAIVQRYSKGSINTRANFGSYARQTYKLDKSKVANGVLMEFGFENYLVPFERPGDNAVHYFIARGDYAAQWEIYRPPHSEEIWRINGMTYGRTTGYMSDTVDFIQKFFGIFERTWANYFNETDWVAGVLDLFTDDAVFLPKAGYCDNTTVVYRGKDQLRQVFTIMGGVKDTLSAFAVDYFEGDIDNPKPDVQPLLATGTYYLYGPDQTNPQGQLVMKIKKDDWDHPTRYGWQIPYFAMSLC